MPDQGPASGGHQIVLFGTGLDSTVAIRFGDVEALDFQPMGPIRISCVVPPNPPGTYDLYATLADGTTVEVGKYTYG